jgi:hypothetical protein
MLTLFSSPFYYFHQILYPISNLILKFFLKTLSEKLMGNFNMDDNLKPQRDNQVPFFM